MPSPFDVIVIGSGFGGAITARRLAEKGMPGRRPGAGVALVPFQCPYPLSRELKRKGLVGAVGNAFLAFSKERWTRSVRPRRRQLPQTARIIRYDRKRTRPPRRECQRGPAPQAPNGDVRLGEVDRE